MKKVWPGPRPYKCHQFLFIKVCFSQVAFTQKASFSPVHLKAVSLGQKVRVADKYMFPKQTVALQMTLLRLFLDMTIFL